MWIARTIEQCREYRGALQATTALVPTMGALHAGHHAHISAAHHLAQQVIVSIFVNPTQFGPTEDFDQYPRPIEADLAVCEREGVTGVFHPLTEQLYIPSAAPSTVTVPALASLLEGKLRPGHFEGVCRVVMKLLHIVVPDLVTFGHKDYQQLCIVCAMIRDLNVPVELVPIDTVRDADGLAVSSRNAHLDNGSRQQAGGLYASLCEMRQALAINPSTSAAPLEEIMRRVLCDHGIEIDYAVIRDAKSLALLPPRTAVATVDAVALVAGRVGNVRLIDNMLLGRGQSSDVVVS